MTTDSRRSQIQILFRHLKRPRWGLAVLAWDHGDTRGFQFEDGKLRVFNNDFFGLLEEVDPPADQTRLVLAHLNRALGRSEAVKRAGSKQEELVPFAEQINYIKEQYPDGFGGAAWTASMRGVGAQRELKRHRDPAVARARKQLAGTVLERLIKAKKYDEVINTMIAVLEQTSLVGDTKLKPLRAAPSHRRPAIAVALLELLHGKGAIDPRFESFVSNLDEPSWELATAPLALLHPEQHVCVTPSVFKQQALWLAPRMAHPRRPAAATYQRYLELARAIHAQLEGAGLGPRDHLDVYDFIALTLRPATRKLLAERASARDTRVAATHSGSKAA